MTSPQDPWLNQNAEASDDDSEQRPQGPLPPQPPQPPRPPQPPQRPSMPQPQGPNPQHQGPGPQFQGHHPQQQVPRPGQQYQRPQAQSGPQGQRPAEPDYLGQRPYPRPSLSQQVHQPSQFQAQNSAFKNEGSQNNDEQPLDTQLVDLHSTHKEHGQLTHPAESAYAGQGPVGPSAAYSDQLLSMWVDWSNKALVVKAILLANVVMFVLMVIASGGKELTNPTADFLINWGANAGAYTLDGDYWRILSAAFLHGSFLHIAMNMAVLWDVGPLVERIYGSKRFLILYLFAAVTASLNTLFWNPGGVSVGASGAVFGAFGALLAFYQSHRKTIPAHVIKEKSRVVAAVIGYNLIFGLLQPNIDNAGHVGGLIGGFLMGIVLSPREPLQRRVRLLEVLGVAVSAALCFGVWHADKMVPMDKTGSFAIQSALKLHSAGRGAEALKYLNRYIDEVHGDEPAARLLRAEILMDDRSKMNEAMQDIDTILKANPNSGHANQMKAYVLLRQGHPNEAINYTQQGLKNAGDSGLGLLLIQAEALITTTRFQDAVDTLTGALKVDSKFATAYAMRGICYRQLQQNELAKTDFEKAIQLGAGGPDVYRGLGLINFLDGKFEDAAANYGKAIEAGNDNSSQFAFSFILKYFAELRMGNQAQAEQTLIAASTKVKDMPWPSAIVDYLLGKKSAAALEKQAKDIGELSEAKTYIGLTFWSKGRFDTANPYFAWVVAHAPKSFIEYEIARRMLAGGPSK